MKIVHIRARRRPSCERLGLTGGVKPLGGIPFTLVFSYPTPVLPPSFSSASQDLEQKTGEVLSSPLIKNICSLSYKPLSPI